MIKKICLGVFRFEIGALRKKLGCLVHRLINLTQQVALQVQSEPSKVSWAIL